MEKKEFSGKLIKDCQEFGVEVKEAQAEKMHRFICQMKEWNEKINLTNITEDEEIISKHLVDSLTLLQTGKLDGAKKLIDVGTGAGFPAIPLKILRPELEIVLLDSLNKRLKYLNEVIVDLKLKGIETLHSRAEDSGKDKNHREAYDIVTARAVANLATLSELCLPFVKVGGYFLCMKGPAYREELKDGEKAIEVLGGKLEETIPCRIPNTDLTHHILVIKKIESTPKQYPRKAGTPNSKPIQ